MSVDKLKRVLWRLREKGIADRLPLIELERAIMRECGTTPITISRNIKALIKLGWIRRSSRYVLYITAEAE